MQTATHQNAFPVAILIVGDNHFCPLMPEGHSNPWCNCPDTRAEFEGPCHSNGNCNVIERPEAQAEAACFD